MMHSGASLLRVQPLRCSDDLATAPKSLFRILWLAHPWDKSLRQLHVLPPGSSADLTFGHSQAGYLVSFPEEILLMTGCQHYYPFAGAQPSVRQHEKPIPVQDGLAIERMITNLARECAHHAGEMLIPGLLKVLIISIARLYPQPEAVVSECDELRLFQRFMKLVKDRKSGRRSVQEYANALSVKTEMLTECVRKVSGYPASHHIYEHIIHVAKHAAISSGASMKEVAYGLGFNDMAHFSKFFRSKTGMTFSNYKRAYQAI